MPAVRARNEAAAPFLIELDGQILELKWVNGPGHDFRDGQAQNHSQRQGHEGEQSRPGEVRLRSVTILHV